MMGIRHFVFALNKMDLVGYDKQRYSEILRQIRILSGELELQNVQVVPVSATEGDNVTTKSVNMPWYEGESLLTILEQVDIDIEEEEGFILPIQRVCRPDHTFRGFAGQIESGEVHIGDTVKALPSNEEARVERIFRTAQECDSASSGMPASSL